MGCFCSFDRAMGREKWMIMNAHGVERQLMCWCLDWPEPDVVVSPGNSLNDTQWRLVDGDGRATNNFLLYCVFLLWFFVL